MDSREYGAVMTPKDYLTVAEVADELEMTPSGVYKLIQRGRLKAIRKTAHGTRIARIALDAYLRRVAGEEPLPIASMGAGEQSLSDLRAEFERETGRTPEQWQRLWKDDRIEDTHANMIWTVRSLALNAAEAEGAFRAGQNPLLMAAFSRTS